MEKLTIADTAFGLQVPANPLVKAGAVFPDGKGCLVFERLTNFLDIVSIELAADIGFNELAIVDVMLGVGQHLALQITPGIGVDPAGPLADLFVHLLSRWREHRVNSDQVVELILGECEAGSSAAGVAKLFLSMCVFVHTHIYFLFRSLLGRQVNGRLSPASLLA